MINQCIFRNTNVELRILYMQKEGFVLIFLYNNFTLDACRYNRYSSWYIVIRVVHNVYMWQIKLRWIICLKIQLYVHWNISFRCKTVSLYYTNIFSPVFKSNSLNTEHFDC